MLSIRFDLVWQLIRSLSCRWVSVRGTEFLWRCVCQTNQGHICLLAKLPLLHICVSDILGLFLIFCGSGLMHCFLFVRLQKHMHRLKTELSGFKLNDFSVTIWSWFSCVLVGVCRSVLCTPGADAQATVVTAGSLSFLSQVQGTNRGGAGGGLCAGAATHWRWPEC